MVEVLPQEIIRKKRDGNRLNKEDINLFINNLVSGKISHEQASALTMAIFFNGMISEETADLTNAMINSGKILQWSNGPPVVDKHSTGGVGDKVSLILAPILAACGCRVPMISGRGLGFTGGTLDKLDSIPGYNSKPNIELLSKTVNNVGCAIVGQTSDLAPADKILYSIRDITATVESVPLITASILSKKCAAGLDALVMDIKVGSGAFCEDLESAMSLAISLEKTAKLNNLKFSHSITDMNQVLGLSAGNAIEVLESITWMKDLDVDPYLEEVTLNLGSKLLVSCGIAKDLAVARKMQKQVLQSGEVANKFSEMVFSLGGPKDLIENANKYLPLAEQQIDIFHDKSGVVTKINTRKLGNIIVGLGGGRQNIDDIIDPSVGISHCCKLSSKINNKTLLCKLFISKNNNDTPYYINEIKNCFYIEEKNTTAKANKLIYR